MAPRLYYLIGASGAGKDSLLRYARDHLPAAAPVAFAHRYITRPVVPGDENHVALGRQEFANRLAHGCFAMHWRSHGVDYGIGEEIRLWMASGLHVILNGSRHYLATAAGSFPNLVPVLVEVRPTVLRRRLWARGRESSADMEARLRRGTAFEGVQHPELVRIDNNGAMQQAGETLMRVIGGQWFSGN